MTITMGSHQASCKCRKKIAIVGCEEIKDDGLLENGRLRYLATNSEVPIDLAVQAARQKLETILTYLAARHKHPVRSQTP